MQQNQNGARRRRYNPDQQPQQNTQSYRIQGYQPQYQQPTQTQPTYQQQYPQYQQPTYQSQQPEQPQPTQTARTSSGKKRDKVLMASWIIALIWFIVVCSSFASLMSATPTGSDAEQLGQEIGTAIGFVLQIPFLITSFLGLVFNLLGWGISKKGFALTAGILFSVSFFLSIGNGFGYIPCLVLCFIGYSRLKKRTA